MGLKDIIGGAAKDGKDAVTEEYSKVPGITNPFGWDGNGTEDDMGAPEEEPKNQLVKDGVEDGFNLQNDIEVDESPDAPFAITKKFPSYLTWSKHPSDELKSAMYSYGNKCCEILNSHDKSLGEDERWVFDGPEYGFVVYKGDEPADDIPTFTSLWQGDVNYRSIGSLPNDVRKYLEKEGSPMTNAEAEDLRQAQVDVWMTSVDDMNAVNVVVNPPLAIGEDGIHNAGPWGDVDLTQEIEFQKSSTSDRVKFNKWRQEAGVTVLAGAAFASKFVPDDNLEEDGTSKQRQDFVPAFYDESVGVRPDDPMAVNVKFADDIPWSNKPTADQAAEMRSYLSDCCDILNKHDPSVNGTWQVGPSGELVCCDAEGNAVKNTVKMMPNEIRLYCESVGSPLTNEDALLMKTHLDSFENLVEVEMKDKTNNTVAFITKEGVVEKNFNVMMGDWKQNHREIQACSPEELEAIKSNREFNGIDCPMAHLPVDEIVVGPNTVIEPKPAQVIPGYPGIAPEPKPAEIRPGYTPDAVEPADGGVVLFGAQDSYKDKLASSFDESQFKDAFADTHKKHKAVDKEMESLTESIQGAAQKEDDEPLFGLGKFGQ